MDLEANEFSGAPTTPELDYHSLNAKLNLLGADGKIQFEADKEAARQFFLQHVNQNTVFFHNLEEKLDYLEPKLKKIIEIYPPSEWAARFERAFFEVRL